MNMEIINYLSNLLNQEIIKDSKVKKASIKLNMICTICGKEEEITLDEYNNFKNKYICKKCKLDREKADKTIYNYTLEELKNNSYELIYLETPICPNSDIIVRCKKCKEENKYKYNEFMSTIEEKKCCKAYEALKHTQPSTVCSYGEEYTKYYLDSKNILYTTQNSLGCTNPKTTCPLPFDFVIRNNNETVIIEIDGEQHYTSVEYFGGEEGLKTTQYRDNIKNEFCKNNGYKLYRIRWQRGVYKRAELVQQLENIMKENNLI